MGDNIASDAFNWLTTSPDFIKKRAKKLHDSVESPSVFDSTAEKFGKPAIHAAIDTADTFATPADAAGLLAGGAGFAGAGIANRLRRLPRFGARTHYLDAIQLGKTHPEALKIASSSGRTAADRKRIADMLEAEGLGQGGPKPKPISKGTPQKAPYLRTIYGPAKNTGGRGKSVIDLAEAIRKRSRNPYTAR